MKENGLIPEVERIKAYINYSKEDYSKWFARYIDYENLYSKKDFRMRTCGIGMTSLFRKELHRYIKAFGEKELNGNGDTVISFNQDNVIVAKGGKVKKEELNFVCFLYLNDFWNRIEQVRNYQAELIPIVLDQKDENTKVFVEYAKFHKKKYNLEYSIKVI